VIQEVSFVKNIIDSSPKTWTGESVHSPQIADLGQ